MYCTILLCSTAAPSAVNPQLMYVHVLACAAASTLVNITCPMRGAQWKKKIISVQMKTFQSTLEHSDALSNQGSALAIHVTQARQLLCSLKCICSTKKYQKSNCFFVFFSSMDYRAFKSTFGHPLSGDFSHRPSSWVARQVAQLENHPMIESAEDETSCDRKLPCDRKNATGCIHNISPCPPNGRLCGRRHPNTSPAVSAIFEHLCPRHCEPRHSYHSEMGRVLCCYFYLWWGSEHQRSSVHWESAGCGWCDPVSVEAERNDRHTPWRRGGNDETTLGCHETEPPH